MIVSTLKGRSFIVATATLLFSSCASLVPTNPVPITEQSSFTQTEVKHVNLSEEIKELALDQAILLALDNNPDFLATASSIRAAWTRYYQAISGYYPTLSAGYSYDGSVNRPVNQHGGSRAMDTGVNSHAIGIGANWVIFDGLAREMNMLASEHSAIQEEYLQKNAQRLLIRSVIIAYNNILLSREQIRIAKEDRVFNEKLLSETKTKFQLGAVSRSEVLNFEVQLNNSEVQLVIAQHAERNGRFILGELMGLTVGDIPEVVNFPKIQEQQYVLASVETYLDTALKNRPDLQAYREALLAAEYQLYSRYSGYLPVVSAYAEYQTDYNVSRTHLNNHQVPNVSHSRWNSNGLAWGVNVNWLLFDGFAREERIKESKELLTQYQYAVASQWITVISEVRQAHQNYLNLLKQLELYRKKVNLVRETRDLVEVEYRSETVTIVRLNEAQRDVVSAETGLATAIIELMNAKAQLDAMVGLNEIPVIPNP